MSLQASFLLFCSRVLRGYANQLLKHLFNKDVFVVKTREFKDKCIYIQIQKKINTDLKARANIKSKIQQKTIQGHLNTKI